MNVQDDGLLYSTQRHARKYLPSLYTLIEKRCQGGLNGLEFRNRLYRKHSLKTLSRRTILHSTERSITSLQIHPAESRFLITGSTSGKCSIYDLSRLGSTVKHQSASVIDPSASTTTIWTHKPIAQTNPLADATMEDAITMQQNRERRRNRQRLPAYDDYDDYDVENEEVPVGPRFVGPVTCTRWYPPDSGAFLSTHVSGNFCLWDTNAMVPVLQIQPFASDVQTVRDQYYQEQRPAVLTTMETTTLNPYMVAVASIDVPTIRLVDIRSGAAAHSLQGGHGRSGVSALQWASNVAHVLATGGVDGTMRLWDIRKAGRHAWIGDALDKESLPQYGGDEDLVRAAYRPDYSHSNSSSRRRNHTMTATNNTNMSIKMRRQQKPRQQGPHDYSETKRVRSHTGSVTALSFTGAGQYLVSYGLDHCVRLWDLYTQQCVPRTFALPAAGPRMARQVRLLCVDDIDHALWLAQGSTVYQFDWQKGGAARQCLEGHLNHVQAMDSCPESGNLITGGADGVCLVWTAASSFDGTREVCRGPGRRARGKRLREDMDTW